MAVTRADRLQALVEATQGKPVVWDRDGSDCTSWPTLWFEAERGIRLDLPEYHSEAEAKALIAEAGGLDVLWRNALLEAGAQEVAYPQLGDVGVFRTSRGTSGCIFGTDGIAFVRCEQTENREAGVWMIRPRNSTILTAFAT